jgi:hypothetical protein
MGEAELSQEEGPQGLNPWGTSFLIILLINLLKFMYFSP